MKRPSIWNQLTREQQLQWERELTAEKVDSFRLELGLLRDERYQALVQKVKDDYHEEEEELRQALISTRDEFLHCNRQFREAIIFILECGLSFQFNEWRQRQRRYP